MATAITHDDIQWLSELENTKRMALHGQIIPDAYKRRLMELGLIEERSGELELTEKGRELVQKQYTRT